MISIVCYCVVVLIVQVSWISRISQMVIWTLMMLWSRFRSLDGRLRLDGPDFCPRPSALQRAPGIVQNYLLEIH